MLLRLTPRLARCWKVSLGVVHGDRPEPVHGDVTDAQLVVADGQAGVDIDVERLDWGEATPSGGRTDKVLDRVHFGLRAERAAKTVETCFASSRIAFLVV